MARIAGLTFEKYSNGSIKKVTFDYKKHSEVLKPLLQNMGAVEDDEFEKEWAKGGYTSEQAKAQTKKMIRLLWENQK